MQYILNNKYYIEQYQLPQSHIFVCLFILPHIDFVFCPKSYDVLYERVHFILLFHSMMIEECINRIEVMPFSIVM